jgi:hypothetical protein
MQNVQEIVATMLQSHEESIAELRALVTSQASTISTLTRDSIASEVKISQLEKLSQERGDQVAVVSSLSSRISSLELSLSQQSSARAHSELLSPSPHPTSTTTTVDEHTALSSLASRVEALEIDRKVDENNAKVIKMVEDKLSKFRTPPGSPTRTMHHDDDDDDDSPDYSSAIDSTNQTVASLRVEIAELSKLIESTVSVEELEDVREEIWHAIDASKQAAAPTTSLPPNPADFNNSNKENIAADSSALKNAILDEVAISRPDRVEIERLVMTRLEPVAGSLNALHVEMGEMRRHVTSLPPVPSGIVDGEQLGQTVNDAVRRALSGDGGRVSHAHLTVAIDNAREGLLRQIEGTVGAMRASLLDNFSGELGETKENTWDALASLRGRVDDLERVVEQSNTEMVAVLNKKAYKADVANAMAKKADNAVTINTLRLKADAQTVSAEINTKADAVETSERIERVNVALGSCLRDVKDAKDEMRGEVARLAEKITKKVDADEVEGLKLGVISGADWRSAVSDVSMNLRRELADKANREEMVKMIRREVDNVKENIEIVRGTCDDKSDAQSTNQLVADLESLSNKFAEAHSEARWLWRSGKILRGGWIPWEVQVNNAAPSSLLWKAECEAITCVVPGLYSVRIGVFTMNASSVQVCVNGEPVISLDPNNEISSVAAGGPMEFIKRRHRHTAGDITSVVVDEVMALPPNAVLGVRYDSGTRAQGFMSVRKM